MELGQTHPVRVLNDQGVDVGNVDAGLDDGGADQNLHLALHHPFHDPGQFLLAHLAVAHRHGDLFSHHPLDVGGGLFDGVHPVVEEVDLAAPAHLPAHGVGQYGPVVLQHIGLHRQPVLGRLLDGGHIPDAGQGHVQGPGNGGGGQGEHIHLSGNLLEPFLVGDPEALLLVHHQQSQVLKDHVLLEQPVGADEHVNKAPGQVRQNLL